MFERRPRVFLSYRHQDRGEAPGAREHNARHVAFVDRLAADLQGWGVEVVHDGRIRRMLQPLFEKDAALVPIVADVAVASIAVCHAFMPVLTPGYIERLGFADFERRDSAADGYVHEEWQIGMTLVNQGRQDYVPVVRDGRLEDYAKVPLGVEGRAFDLRDGVDYSDTVERIADQLQMGWTVERPPIEMGLKAWIEEFLRQRIQMNQAPKPL